MQCNIVNLSKTFDQSATQFALSDLSLEVKDGELMVFVGPSGCGKSTTLRCIAGLEFADSGRIFIGDRDVTWLAPGERDVAMVFQNYALYPHLRVIDNLKFGLRQRRLAAAEIRRRVDAAVEMLQIGGMLDRWPSQLSGGQQQRVAIGRAMVRHARMFLLDEPLSSLDAHLRVQMRGEIRNLQQRLGMTSIFVTHDQEEALSIGDRVAILRAGRLEQLAPPLELYRLPCNTFVAAFIGNPPMNLLKATIADGRILLGDDTLPVPPQARPHLPPAGPVLLGVRAEAVAVTADAAGAACEVVVVEQLGARARVVGELLETERQRIVLEVPAEQGERMRPGEILRCQMPADGFLVFDPVSEKRLFPPLS